MDLGDFMTFELGHDAEHPTIQNDGMQYEGRRFRAECKLVGYPESNFGTTNLHQQWARPY